MRYSKRNEHDEVLDIEVAKDIPDNKFRFSGAIYPCCERHMRLELEASAMKYRFSVFAQRDMKKCAIVFIYADTIIHRIKDKLHIADKWNWVENSAYDMR